MISELFSSFDLRQSLEPITDFGGYYVSTPNFYELYPTSINEACEIMARASAHRIPIRVRGNGHSMNGSSLPRKQELVIRSEALNNCQFVSDCILSVGSGVPISDLRKVLKGRSEPFGSGFGPTLGGFISAGGLDRGHLGEMEGFWNIIVEVTLVTTDGTSIQVKKDNPLFPWLFGSMGQFGFIAEAKIKILSTSLHQNKPLLPATNMFRNSPPADKYSWFTLFISPDEEEFAADRLRQFAKHHETSWIPMDLYRHTFAYRDIAPLLVYPHQQPFVGIGVWGKSKDDKFFDPNLLKKLDADFHTMVLSEKNFRRYIQIEWTPESIDYQNHFGRNIYLHFLHLKKQLDHCMLLNQGTVFPMELCAK